MEITREIITKTAKDLFMKYGVRSISIDDICSKLHISKKTFYVHFKDKEELIGVVMNWFMDHKHKNVKKKLTCNDSLNSIDIMLDINGILRLSKTNHLMCLIYDLGKYYPEILANYVEEIDKQMEKNIRHFLIKGIESGLFRKEADSDTAVKFFSSFMKSLNNTSLSLSVPINEYIELGVDFLVRMIATEYGLNYYISKKELLKAEQVEKEKMAENKSKKKKEILADNNDGKIKEEQLSNQ